MNLQKEEIEEMISEKIAQGVEKYGKSFKLYSFELIKLIKSLNTATTHPTSRIIPLSEWDNYHPYPTVPALRQYYFKRQTNGFDSVVVHGGNNGGRILIDEAKFFDWLKSRKNGD